QRVGARPVHALAVVAGALEGADLPAVGRGRADPAPPLEVAGDELLRRGRGGDVRAGRLAFDVAHVDRVRRRDGDVLGRVLGEPGAVVVVVLVGQAAQR